MKFYYVTNIFHLHIIWQWNGGPWNELWKFVLKKDFHEVFDKSLVKININKKSEKTN